MQAWEYKEDKTDDFHQVLCQCWHPQWRILAALIAKTENFSDCGFFFKDGTIVGHSQQHEAVKLNGPCANPGEGKAVAF